MSEQESQSAGLDEELSARFGDGAVAPPAPIAQVRAGAPNMPVRGKVPPEAKTPQAERQSPYVATISARTAAAAKVDPELESAVIGLVLSDPTAIRAVTHLAPSIFSDQSSAKIWSAMLALHRRGVDVDPATVPLEMGEADFKRIGGRAALDQRLAFATRLTRASLDMAASRLSRLATRRFSHDALVAAQQELEDEAAAPEEVASKVRETLRQVLVQGGARAHSASETAHEGLAHLRRMKANPTSTGLLSLDEIMGMLRPGRLYVIAGRPGTIKTTLAQSISYNLALDGKPHTFISAEMLPREIEMRNACRSLGITSEDLDAYDDPGYADLIAAVERYCDTAGDTVEYIRDPAKTFDQICSDIRAAGAAGREGFIYDHFQKLKKCGPPRGISMNDFLDNCATELRDLCGDEGMWGLVTCQCDEFGQPLDKCSGIYDSASFYAHAVREQNTATVAFRTMKNNHGPLRNIRPGLVLFDNCGPHIREATDEDNAELARAEAEPNGG